MKKRERLKLFEIKIERPKLFEFKIEELILWIGKKRLKPQFSLNTILFFFFYI